MSNSRSLVEVNPSMKIVRELSYEELLQQEASRLPERDTMDLISLNLAAPINAAVAANVLTDASTAVAQATQTADIAQDVGQ
jgi:hypothetical protein